VDMAGAVKVEQGGEMVWQHAPTEADAAALLDKKPIDAKWATLYVNGLGCPQCATNIDLTLAKTGGVSWMYVDLGHGVVQMKMDPSGKKPSPYDLKNRVTDAGFTLVKIRTK
jgi:copper chaperone CopZ